jgi:proteasome alpha subunit
VRLALEALASVNDDELSPEGIDVATIDVETERFHELTDDEKTGYLEEFGLLKSDDEEPTDEETTDEE